MVLTSRPPTTNRPITRTIRLAPNIPDPRIQQTLVLEIMTIHVFNPPETPRGDRSLLCAFGEGHGGCCGCCSFGVEVHGGAGEGPEEALQESRHGVGCYQSEEKEGDLSGGLQFAGGDCEVLY